MSEPFWLNKPSILFSTLTFIPSRSMTESERLNALSRLLIIIVIGMYLLGYDHSLTVLVLGFLLIMILHSNQSREHFQPHRGAHDPCHTCGFDSNMAYINSKYEESPQNQFSHLNDGLRSYTHAHYKVIPPDVPSPYREVWRKEDRFCNEFSRYPKSYSIIPDSREFFNQPENKCHYADREWIDNVPSGRCWQGKESAMPAIQSAFIRDSSTFRNNIMGDYIDQIERTRQHNCVDFKPGRKTF